MAPKLAATAPLSVRLNRQLFINPPKEVDSPLSAQIASFSDSNVNV